MAEPEETEERISDELVSITKETTRTRTRLRTELDSRERERLRIRLNNLIKAQARARSKAKAASSEAAKARAKIRSAQKAAQVQAQKEAQAMISPLVTPTALVRAKPFPLITPPIIPPLIPLIPLPKPTKIPPVKKIKKRKVVVKVYMPQGKIKGKYKNLSRNPMKKIDALSRMTKAIDHTTAAQGRIMIRKRYKKLSKVSGLEKGYYNKVRKKFRTHRIVKKKKIPLKNLGHIEYRKHRIDTRGEKAGLKLAKMIKQKRWLLAPKKKKKPRKRKKKVKKFPFF